MHAKMRPCYECGYAPSITQTGVFRIRFIAVCSVGCNGICPGEFVLAKDLIKAWNEVAKAKDAYLLLTEAYEQNIEEAVKDKIYQFFMDHDNEELRLHRFEAIMALRQFRGE